MNCSNNIDLDDVAFKLKVDEKFSITGRGVFVTGKIALGKISSNDKVIITDKTGKIKKNAIARVEFFCSSKMEQKNTAYESMNIAIELKDIILDEIAKGDYIIIK